MPLLSCSILLEDSRWGGNSQVMSGIDRSSNLNCTDYTLILMEQSNEWWDAIQTSARYITKRDPPWTHTTLLVHHAFFGGRGLRSIDRLSVLPSLMEWASSEWSLSLCIVENGKMIWCGYMQLVPWINGFWLVFKATFLCIRPFDWVDHWRLQNIYTPYVWSPALVFYAW